MSHCRDCKGELTDNESERCEGCEDMRQEAESYVAMINSPTYQERAWLGLECE